MGILRWWPVLVAGMLAGPHPAADARELSPEEKRAIGERLAPVVNSRLNLQLEEGSTLFVVHRVRTQRAKVPGNLADYEGFVTSIEAPKGIFVDDRVDEVTLSEVGPGAVLVAFRYAISANPGLKKKAPVSFKLRLVSRTSIGQIVLTVPNNHELDVVPAAPSAAELAADFWGYRTYKKLADERMNALARRGVRNLTLNWNGGLPPSTRYSTKVALAITEFDQWRRRMWIAYRHLAVARRSPVADIAKLAQLYSAHLDKSDDALGALPKIDLVRDATP